MINEMGDGGKKKFNFAGLLEFEQKAVCVRARDLFLKEAMTVGLAEDSPYRVAKGKQSEEHLLHEIDLLHWLSTILDCEPMGRKDSSLEVYKLFLVAELTYVVYAYGVLKGFVEPISEEEKTEAKRKEMDHMRSVMEKVLALGEGVDKEQALKDMKTLEEAEDNVFTAWEFLGDERTEEDDSQNVTGNAG